MQSRQVNLIKEIMVNNYKVNAMQTTDILYDLGKTISLGMQILIVTRVLYCVLIVTGTSCYVIQIKCQSELYWTNENIMCFY